MHDDNPNKPIFTYDPLKDKSHKIQGIKPRRRWKKVALVSGLIVLIIGVVFGLYLFRHISKISTNPFGGFGKLKGESDGRVNILLLGIGDPGHDGEKLADTNMVVSINTKANQVAMISIPRDTRVNIPGYGYGKINQAHSDGFYGAGDSNDADKQAISLAEQTASTTLDIPIHYFVRANFTGLKQIVDAVGGVDINVQQDLYDPEYPCDNNQYRSCGFKITAGQQHMDGTTALKYARCRKGDCGDDFGRAQRQQDVLKAVRTKVGSNATLTNPSKINDLLSALSDNILTDLSINNMLRLKELSDKIDQSKIINVVFSTKDNGFLKDDPAGSSDLLPVGGDFSDIQAFTRDVFKYGPVWVEDPTVAIENGTETPGLAAKLSDRIDQGHYPITVTSVSNALNRNYDKTQIIDYSNGKVPNTIAYFEQLLGVKATSPESPASNPASDIKIIIGADQTPTPSPSLTPQQ